jgi:hypothetical protein
MQLRSPQKSLRRTLAVATATLLGNVPHAADAAGQANSWEVDTAIMFYSETDRVRLVEPVIRGRQDLGDDKYFNVRVVLDTLTGASPNGAIPTNSAQTFTGPSGAGSYSTAANTVPLDPNFKDTRVAVNAEWERPLNQSTRGIFGVNVSAETDYKSIGVAATFNFDFNLHNTTLTTGVSYNSDTVLPIGGAPVGLSVVPVTTGGEGEEEGGGGDNGHGKQVADILLGVTQVLSRKDLIQVNFNLGKESGYLTDPYKLLSVVDSTGALVASPNSYVYEKRPGDRSRTATYVRWSHQFNQDVLRLSYRLYNDDWGIHSSTIDAHYRWELGARHFLEPHWRHYQQTAANFYHTSLLNTQTVSYASADYRLAEMTSTTAGIKYGWLLGKSSEMGVRVEQITQKAQPSNIIGVQSQQVLLPAVKATILQFNYSFLF